MATPAMAASWVRPGDYEPLSRRCNCSARALCEKWEPVLRGKVLIFIGGLRRTRTGFDIRHCRAACAFAGSERISLPCLVMASLAAAANNTSLHQALTGF